MPRIYTSCRAEVINSFWTPRLWPLIISCMPKHVNNSFVCIFAGLYLVVWNICDGEKGLNEIVQWLVNIQVTLNSTKLTFRRNSFHVSCCLVLGKSSKFTCNNRRHSLRPREREVSTRLSGLPPAENP